MKATDLMPNLSQEALDEAAVIPVVQVVDHYFYMNGYEKTKGLIADLIKYVDQLEMNGMPLQ